MNAIQELMSCVVALTCLIAPLAAVATEGSNSDVLRDAPANGVFSESPAGVPTNDPWVAADLPMKSTRAQIILRQERPLLVSQPTFVITHGMGGTETGDRFHQLADAIYEAIPESNVLIVDWSNDSRRTMQFLALPSPWKVATNIDPVANEAFELLQALQIDPMRTTFIGESFGNCVNARIAERMGRCRTILAFNPADRAGGYTTPDLRSCAELSWSFHTYSMFDTLDPIAHAGFFLESSTNASDRDQHIAGVSWLAAQVRSGDQTWVLAQLSLPEPQPGYFDGTATLAGELSQQRPPRQRPVSAEVDERPTVPLLAVTQ